MNNLGANDLKETFCSNTVLFNDELLIEVISFEAGYNLRELVPKISEINSCEKLRRSESIVEKMCGKWLEDTLPD